MHKLLLTTAVLLPFALTPAFAQDAATTPEDPAAETMPAETTPAETMPADAATDPAADPAAAEPAADEAAADAEAEAAAAAEEALKAEVAASGKVAQEQAANEIRLDWVTEGNVTAPDGTAIGSINDLILDGETGQMKAAIIGVGGFLGIGTKQIAVPWDKLMINYDAQEITSDLTKEEAEAAPAYVFREQEPAPGLATADPAAAPADPAAAPADPAAAPADPATAPAEEMPATETEAPAN